MLKYPYTTIYDQEVLRDELLLYDWLHLHHEDFTGQYGKFYRAYRSAPWYIAEKNKSEALAATLGYGKVSQQKRDVALKIRDYVVGGGFMFAMCSATDSFDIALSAKDVDICEPMFDGDASDANYQSKIDFKQTFAFKDYILERSPMVYEFSSIDMTSKRKISKQTDYFSSDGLLCKVGSNSYYVSAKPHLTSKRFYGANNKLYARAY